VAERKRPEGERPERLAIEYYTPEEVTLVRRVRAQAALRGERVREWVLRALRTQLEREEREERELPRVAEDGPGYDPGA
jgi:hypothetical protein